VLPDRGAAPGSRVRHPPPGEQDTEAVLGKFLGAFFFYVALWAPTLVYVLILSRFSPIAMGPVHVCEPVDGVAEISAVARRAGRAHAIAARLEGIDGRWRCTAVQIG